MKKSKIKRVVFNSLAVVGMLIVGIAISFTLDFGLGKNQKWGVTFSRSYALELGLDWQEAYLAILDDLQVDHIRLSAYWNEIEPQKDRYDFSNLDWQVDQAASRDVAVVLAVGRRLPRWPECHDPGWLQNESESGVTNELFGLVEAVVTRYKDNSAILAWQVENEPLFGWFGLCPKPDEKLLAQEITLVRKIDPSRPILVTDSGELSTWQRAARHGDMLGTTLYRVVWNDRLGFFTYWFLPPAYYRWKADVTKLLHPNIGQWIVAELQMEPWTFDRSMTELTIEEQEESFDLGDFRSHVRYATRVGSPVVYLWGAEYWYWKKLQGYPELWVEAVKLWR